MKKLFCLIPLALLLLWGCQKEDSVKPVSFYYPIQNYGYSQELDKFESNAFRQELREDTAGRTVKQLLSLYLDGPVDANLMNPFPMGTEVLSALVQNQTLSLVLSDQLASLTGLPLIVACTGISKTAMALTGVSTVEIRCDTRLLDGKKLVIFNEETVILTDTAGQETTAAE